MGLLGSLTGSDPSWETSPVRLALRIVRRHDRARHDPSGVDAHGGKPIPRYAPGYARRGTSGTSDTHGSRKSCGLAVAMRLKMGGDGIEPPTSWV
jgi:hypothetical protein